MKDWLPALPRSAPGTDFRPAAARRPAGGRRRARRACRDPGGLAAPTIATDAVCLRPSQKPNRDAVSPPPWMTGAGFTPGQVVPIQVGSRTWYTVVEDIGAFLVEIDVSDRLRLPRPSRRYRHRGDGPVPGAEQRAADPHRAAGVLRDAQADPAVQHRDVPVLRLRARPRHLRPLPLRRARAGQREDGQASNPCGLLTARRDQIPVRDPEIGLWRIQFDQRAIASPRATPRIGATVNVFPTSGD